MIITFFYNFFRRLGMSYMLATGTATATALGLNKMVTVRRLL